MGGGDDTYLREYTAALTLFRMLTINSSSRCSLNHLSSAPGQHSDQDDPAVGAWLGKAQSMLQCPQGRCLSGAGTGHVDATIGHQALCSVRSRAVGRNGSDRGSHCTARKGYLSSRRPLNNPHADLLQMGAPIGGRCQHGRSAFLPATLGTSNHHPPGHGGLSIGAVL